jgi:hypothetical protein
MKPKCDTCDERGYISLGGGASKSCECGWAIAQQAKFFEGWTLDELLAYGHVRRAQKGAKNI